MKTKTKEQPKEYRFVVLFVVMGLLLASAIKYGYYDNYYPKYEVGTCIQLVDTVSEPWRRTIYNIRRIEEIGNFSYRTNYFDDVANTYQVGIFDVPFHGQAAYQKVTCPIPTCKPKE